MKKKILNLIKLSFLQLVILSAVQLCFISFSFAQGSTIGEPAEELFDVDDESQSDESSEATEKGEQNLIGQQAALYVLGRKLTQQEKDAFGNDLTAPEIREQFLYKEYRLVIVRALVALEEEKITREAIKFIPNSQIKTYASWIKFFTELKEESGDLLGALQNVYVRNIKDNPGAFTSAARAAWETVYGEDRKDVKDIENYLRENNALTYSRMVEVLVKNMSLESKKALLVKVVTEVGRIDLKNNEGFMKKMLSQDLTYKALIEVLKPLKHEVPSKPKIPTKKPVKR